MQTNRKTLGIVIVVAALIIIFLIIYFFFLRKNEVVIVETPTTPEAIGQLPVGSDSGTSTPSDKPRNYQKYNIDQEAPHKTNADDLGKISMAFAERFGSFSNQSNYGNFTDLKILMTSSMKDWVDKYVADLKDQTKDNTTYYGLTTKALTYEVKKFDETAGKAEILIGTQRRESTTEINGGNPYNQELTLKLIKVNNEWLFDEAYWQKNK
jgi:hypothetical protein